MPIIERKNVLITGGAGFIGSHLCDALVKTAHVICIDNFSTSSVANIEHLLQNPNFEFINHDITQSFSLADFPELERFHLKLQGIQEIYHLACPISKLHFEDFKIASILTSSLGTKTILDIAVASQAKFLFASSSALYGSRREGQSYAVETDPCVLDHLTPNGAYDEGKRFSEAITFTYGEVHHLDVKIARIFRTYGPRMKIHDGNFLPEMMHAALDEKEIELPCEEHAKMCLCYVSDLVDGLMKLMETSQEITVMNLGSDREYPLREIAGTIVQLTDSASSIRCQFDPSFRESPVPDLTLARHVLHWIPLVQLEQGLKHMLDDTKSRRQQTNVFV